MINNALAYCFKEAKLSKTGGSDLEHKNYVGQVSRIIRFLAYKDKDLSSCFDKSGESALNDTDVLKRILIINHIDVNIYKGKLELEHIFGFCKTFKKITKNSGFHITFKTASLQDIIFTTVATDINVTINNLYLYVPFLIPNTQTQVMFIESIMNNYTITFDSWYTERKISNDGRELQVDVGSAQHINSPKCLIGVFQTQNRRGVPNRAINIAIFDTNHVTNFFVEIDGVRYPGDVVLTNFEENSYLDQYRDINLFYKEFVGEQLLNPYISYTDLKNFYSIQVIDLRFQVDHITSKKIQLFEEFSEDVDNERFMIIRIRRREREMISDGNKLIEVKV